MAEQTKRPIFLEQRREDFVFRVAERSNPMGLSCSPHLHRELELVYVQDGHLTAYADSVCVELGPGDIYLSFPNQLHYYRTLDKQDTYMLFIFKPDLFPEYLDLFLGGIPTTPLLKGAGNIPRINTLLYLLLDNEQRKGASDDGAEDAPSREDLLGRRRGYLLALLSELLPHMSIASIPGGESATLRSIISYCAEHFTEPISLVSLEEALHLNKYYISHLFSEKLSLRFNDYVNALRISEACRLLAGTEYNVIEISERVGFNTLRTFNRAFTKQMGVTPSAYRKEQDRPSEERTYTPTLGRRRDFFHPVSSKDTP